ncbi:MAG: hypothetical protein KF809_00205 [Chloroflexi bacterium]|nr:hypothetical protein [Chloroflexota bacterium]
MRRPTRIAMAGAFVLAASALGGGVVAQTPTAVDPPHPAHIHVGLCPEPGEVVFPLNDLVTGGDQMVGVSSAIAVEVSSTNVEAALADIVAGEHAINVHESAEAADVYIACGDIGGNMLGTADLAIGLAEQNGSGHHGVAWLHDNGDGTTRVDVVLLTGPAAAPGGSMPPASAAPGSPPAPGSPAPPEGSAPPAGSPMPPAPPEGSLMPPASVAP